ncbi:hypothetical protein KC19_VG202900 [Ceratodon purpureus]|uniref:Hexosyltransferase n=1 Tax=Ceratodon purpureus TaxID=3225 RepID=A0A8T0HRU2_CERPU|nr:hypothetical protein KC19_VG202900 [Ceratodon purpureus]
MVVEKREEFVGLNGVKIEKENSMRAGLFNSPSPSPQQRLRKEFRRRSPARRRPTYLSLLLVAGVLFIGGFVFVGLPWQPNPSQPMVGRVTSGDGLADGAHSLDSLPRQLGDQMTLCKSYAVIAKENNNLQLAWHLSAQIRAAQQILSTAATRGTAVLWEEAEPIMREMSALIFEAKELHYDSATMLMKLKAEMQALEEMANTAATQSATFGQLAAEAVPKSLHCLSLRLVIKWAADEKLRGKIKAMQKSFAPKLTDTNLYHFCVFSDNVLGASVVINSTIMNSLHPERLVFHVVTDAVNDGAMKTWFALNGFKGVAIEIRNVESFTFLNATYVPVLKQLQDAETQSYYFRSNTQGGGEAQKTALKFRNPKYLSMLNHLRFYIPEVYPTLKKVVFLDDDVVVQRDLSELFSLDLHNNVNGAVETCLESFHRFHKYLNFSHPKIKSHFDPDACGWAFGMNVFDLVKWREKNVTARYHYWQEQNVDRTLWKLGTLPAGLLAFYGLTEPLDRRWHILGLGYDANIDAESIENGAVVHYNGNMKPWLKLAMSRYKPVWERYVDYENSYLQQCNFH